MARPRLAVCIAIGFALMAQGCTAASDRLVTLPSGRRIFISCMGSGSPTVLFESGYRGGASAWYKVQSAVARTTRACAYDRAGYGESDPGPLPRDGESVARDLDAALRAAGIAGPLVMVGHSAGGLYVRLFSDLRPKDVVGMVLVDPSVEHQDQRFAAVFGPGAGGVGQLRELAARCYDAAQAGLLPASERPLARCTPKAPSPGRSDAAWKAAVAEASRASMWSTALSELDTLWTTTSDELDHGRAGARHLQRPLAAAAPGGGRPLQPRPGAAGHRILTPDDDRSSRRGDRRHARGGGRGAPRRFVALIWPGGARRLGSRPDSRQA